MRNWLLSAALAAFLPTAAHAAVSFCAGSSPTFPCASANLLVEEYQSSAGATAPNTSNGAYIVITPASTPALQGPFNVIVMGNDWNAYGIDVSGNWWKWDATTLAWSNLNTTATPTGIGLPTSAPPPPPPPTLPPMAAEWKLNQASISGTTVADASGHNNTATVVNGPLSFGSAGANFNGTSQYVQSTLSLTPLALSVSVWLNSSTLTGSGGGGNPRVVANSHTDADVKGFQLMFNNGGGSGFFDVGNGTSEGRASWVQQLAKNTWYNYIGVYDGSTVKAYINGSQVSSVAYSGGAVAAGTGPNINVGRAPYQGGVDYFAGAVDDVKICTCALTAAQVSTIYQAGPP